MPTTDAATASEPGGFLDNGANRPLKRRIIGLSIALAIEALLLLLLLTIGYGIATEDEAVDDLVTFDAQDFTEEAPPEPEPEPQEQVETQEAPVETPPELVPEIPLPPPAQPDPIILTPPVPTPPPPPPAPPSQPSGPPRVYGPPNAGPPGRPDSARVGTASNGEPLYAARWYREPTDQELAGYLSTASGPGSALIECRTVPDFRVEDCKLLGEVPRGSQIGRAVLAAAWQFRVRPARVGGRSQVGSWVRIRIDYTLRPV